MVQGILRNFLSTVIQRHHSTFLRSAFIATFDNLENPTICPFVVNGMSLHINILPRYIIVFLQWSIWFMATFASLWIFEPGKMIFLTINFSSLHYSTVVLDWHCLWHKIWIFFLKKYEARYPLLHTSFHTFSAVII